MWCKIRTIFTFKMILTNFCNVIYCIKKCFFLLIWISIFFPQAREQDLNNQRVYLIPDSFSRWHQQKIKMKSRLKAVLFSFWILGFDFDSLISKLTFLYFKFFCTMKSDILFGKIYKFCEVHLLLQYWYVIFEAVIFLLTYSNVYLFPSFFDVAVLWLFFFLHMSEISCLKYIFLIQHQFFFSFVSTFIEIIDLLCDFLLFSFRVRSFKVIFMIVCLAVVDVVKLHIIWNYVPNKPMGWKR